MEKYNIEKVVPLEIRWIMGKATRIICWTSNGC